MQYVPETGFSLHDYVWEWERNDCVINNRILLLLLTFEHWARDGNVGHTEP